MTVRAKGGDLPVAGTVFTVLMIGIALGMDAFSLGIGLGAQGLRWRDVARLSLMISFLHVLLPLGGIALGDALHHLFGSTFQKIGAALLLLLGARMTLEAFHRDPDLLRPPLSAGPFKLLAFAFSVSLDSLSVGLSLGSLHIHALLAALLFGALSGILSLAGLYLGRQATHALGDYGQAAGGAVLVVLGLKLFM